MKTYEVDYFYRVTVKVEADSELEAIQKANIIDFSIFADMEGVTAEYMDGYRPEAYEVEKVDG